MIQVALGKKPKSSNAGVTTSKIPDGYLDRVAKGYAHTTNITGVTGAVVDTSALDFVARPEELTVLRDAILTPRKPGIHRLRSVPNFTSCHP